MPIKALNDRKKLSSDFYEANDAFIDEVLGAMQSGQLAPELARAYLAHPVLGPRLREAAAVVAESGAATLDELFGSVDALKLRSSATLFHRAAPDEAVFARVLDRWCGGVPDEATDALLAR